MESSLRELAGYRLISEQVLLCSLSCNAFIECLEEF